MEIVQLWRNNGRGSANRHKVGINSGPLFPEQEIGWLVFPEAEGQGYAFEAASALREWARRERGLSTPVSYVDPDLVFRHFGGPSSE